MTQSSHRYDTRRWTGDSDTVAAIALAIALVTGALGVLTIGAMILH